MVGSFKSSKMEVNVFNWELRNHWRFWTEKCYDKNDFLGRLTYCYVLDQLEQEWMSGWGNKVYSLPIAAIKENQKFSNLKQYRFIILQAWRSEVRNGFHWTEMKV